MQLWRVKRRARGCQRKAGDQVGFSVCLDVLERGWVVHTDLSYDYLRLRNPADSCQSDQLMDDKADCATFPGMAS